MGRRRKHGEPEEQAGAPEWMVTFSDCMTLLLTFFVLLLSFSSFDDKTFRKLRMIFSSALPSVSSAVKENKDAFLSTKQLEYTEDLDEGSEKPTLAKGREDRLKEETEPVDFHSRKVFLIPSKRIFWGKGTAMSSEGHDTLAIMASFLKEVPSRVVISENGPHFRSNDNVITLVKQGAGFAQEDIGLRRAWAVMEYLTTKQGLDKGWFSISAASTVPPIGVPAGRGPSQGTGAEAERMLEIILLERSIYN